MLVAVLGWEWAWEETVDYTRAPVILYPNRTAETCSKESRVSRSRYKREEGGRWSCFLTVAHRMMGAAMERVPLYRQVEIAWRGVEHWTSCH